MGLSEEMVKDALNGSMHQIAVALFLAWHACFEKQTLQKGNACTASQLLAKYNAAISQIKLGDHRAEPTDQSHPTSGVHRIIQYV